MKNKIFVLVLVLQVAWLLGMVGVQEHGLRTGKIIMLETHPADPRDSLRGDYLALSYDISDVPRNRFSPPVNQDLAFGVNICVAVARGTNEFYTVTRASTNALEPLPNEVLLKGRHAYSSWNARSNCIPVQYGLERFYVAEGTGNPQGKLTAQVVVPLSGRPLLKEVFVDGKPYAEAMKNSAR